MITMKKNMHAFKPGRRNFLKGFGILAAGSVATAGGKAGAVMGTARRPIRVGVLLPGSKMYPAMAKSLENGVRTWLDSQKADTGMRPVELVVEHIDHRSSTAVDRAGVLLTRHKVDVVMAFVGYHTAQALWPVFGDTNVPLITADMGANMHTELPGNSQVFHHSLQYWQGSYALGQWAAANLGTRGLINTSFYDSGYDGIAAFRHGFEAAGGEVLATHVTDAPPNFDTVVPPVEDIEKLSPDFVFAAYSDASAITYVRAYHDLGLAAKIPLIGPGFLSAEHNLGAQDDAATGIQTAFAWSPMLTTPGNVAFMKQYITRTGQQADAFALLGYETIQMITTALKASGGDLWSRADFSAALARVTIESPRGRVAMNPDTRTSVGPVYLRRVEGRSNAVVTPLHISQPDIDALLAQISPMRSGWTNTYLCA